MHPDPRQVRKTIHSDARSGSFLTRAPDRQPSTLLHRPVQHQISNRTYRCVLLHVQGRRASKTTTQPHQPTARTATTDEHGALDHHHHDNATHPRGKHACHAQSKTRHPMRPRASPRNSLDPAWSGKASASSAGKLRGCVLAPPIYLKALVGACCVCSSKRLQCSCWVFPCDEETVVGILAGFFLGSAGPKWLG